MKEKVKKVIVALIFVIATIFALSRPLSKLSYNEEMLGAYGAQNRSVYNIHEDLSTGATQHLPLEVEFPKRSNTISQIKSDESFKNEDERVYENVHDRGRASQKDEGSFKNGNWYNSAAAELPICSELGQSFLRISLPDCAEKKRAETEPIPEKQLDEICEKFMPLAGIKLEGAKPDCDEFKRRYWWKDKYPALKADIDRFIALIVKASLSGKEEDFKELDPYIQYPFEFVVRDYTGVYTTREAKERVHSVNNIHEFAAMLHRVNVMNNTLQKENHTLERLKNQQHIPSAYFSNTGFLRLFYDHEIYANIYCIDKNGKAMDEDIFRASKHIHLCNELKIKIQMLISEYVIGDYYENRRY